MKNAIEILSVSGYEKTEHLKSNVKKALIELGLDVSLKEVTAIEELMSSEIEAIPALRVNGEILFQRFVPSVEVLKSIFRSLK